MIFVAYTDVVSPRPFKGTSSGTTPKRRRTTSTLTNRTSDRNKKPKTAPETGKGKKSVASGEPESLQKKKKQEKEKEKENEQVPVSTVVPEQEIRYYLESSLLGPGQKLTLQHHLTYKQPMPKSFLEDLLKAAEAARQVKETEGGKKKKKSSKKKKKSSKK